MVLDGEEGLKRWQVDRPKSLLRLFSPDEGGVDAEGFRICLGFIYANRSEIPTRPTLPRPPQFPRAAALAPDRASK